MEGDEAQKVSVSLYDRDRDLVEKVREWYHFSSFSGALRFMLRDWARERQIAEQDAEPDSHT